MDRVPSRDHLEQVVRPVVERHGIDLEEVHVAPVGRRSLVRVVVDKDGGVTLDELADVTRLVSTELDGDDVMEDSPYTLEVTSPGVDRPLTLPRHWRRNAGRLVQILQADGTTLTGRIVSAGEAEAVLEAGGEHRSVAYTGVRRARVQVEFSKPDRDSRGAEEG